MAQLTICIWPHVDYGLVFLVQWHCSVFASLTFQCGSFFMNTLCLYVGYSNCDMMYWHCLFISFSFSALESYPGKTDQGDSFFTIILCLYLGYLIVILCMSLLILHLFCFQCIGKLPRKAHNHDALPASHDCEERAQSWRVACESWLWGKSTIMTRCLQVMIVRKDHSHDALPAGHDCEERPQSWRVACESRLWGKTTMMTRCLRVMIVRKDHNHNALPWLS